MRTSMLGWRIIWSVYVGGAEFAMPKGEELFCFVSVFRALIDRLDHRDASIS